ncbi:MAG TPA: transaldolase [Bryobacteraceae bacterium]|nr:transaldolase [Bryobacteraceae bacterium]
MHNRLTQLNVKVFADGADIAGIRALRQDPIVKGFTTNPTLMRQAGISDYEAFAHEVLSVVPDLPISFEVFSDDFDEMYAQARQIASWGDNVYVKIPITNTEGASAGPLVRTLSREGVKLNVTAILTLEQVDLSMDALAGGSPAYVSVFAGRIADTGRDPVPVMTSAVAALSQEPQVELIWASPRELLNIFQADQIGCHVITVTHEMLKKLSTVGRDLEQFSLETVRMFRRDAVAAGFQLTPERAAVSALAN